MHGKEYKDPYCTSQGDYKAQIRRVIKYAVDLQGTVSKLNVCGYSNHTLGSSFRTISITCIILSSSPLRCHNRFEHGCHMDATSEDSSSRSPVVSR